MKSYFIPYKNKGGTVVDWDFTNPIHCLSWYNHSNGYTMSSVGRKKVYMHRFLLNFPDEVDHINGKRNDNRLLNIRQSTHIENLQNMKQHISGKLPGTILKKGKYEARCQINGKYKYLGRYDTEQEAYEKYLEEVNICLNMKIKKE